MFKCKDVHHLVASGHAEELGWMGRMNMKMHLLMCRHCRNYVEQMRAIGDSARSLWRDRTRTTETEEGLEREILAGIPTADQLGDPD